MRRTALIIGVIVLIFLLAGCVAPHTAQLEHYLQTSGDVVLLHSPEKDLAAVTLRPRPSSTPSPTALPKPTPETTPTAEPTATFETPESLPGSTVGPQGGPELSAPSDGQARCYLTFDDGPSKNTSAILQILTEKGVHATFFVVGTNASAHPDRLRAIVDQGSVVANHTQTHATDTIYKSSEAFLNDLNAGRDTLYSILGDDFPKDLIRFPYGSTNRRCRDYRADIKSAGYRWFDWNALNGDAESNAASRSSSDLLRQLKETVDTQHKKNGDVIVLMHDTNSKTKTVEMLGDAIDYIQSLGYILDTLEDKPMN